MNLIEFLLLQKGIARCVAILASGASFVLALKELTYYFAIEKHFFPVDIDFHSTQLKV